MISGELSGKTCRTRRSGARQRFGDLPQAMLFLLPTMSGFALFVLFPIVFSLILAFTNWSLKPAVVPEFIGFDNIWNLVGLRRIDGTPTIAAAGSVLVGYLMAWATCGAGLLLIIVGQNRKWDGLRAGGRLGVLASLILIVLAAMPGYGIDWALKGILFFFVSVVPALDEDGRTWGPAVSGPAIFLLGVAGVAFISGPFFAQWGFLDPKFYETLYNTFFLMIAVPIQLAVSLILALLLSRPLVRAGRGTAARLTLLFIAVGLVGVPWLYTVGGGDGALVWCVFWAIAALGSSAGRVGYRTLFYLPSFTAGVAIMLLWKQILNPNFGLLNRTLLYVLEPLGIQESELPRWLLDPTWAKPALILMGLWICVGGANMLIFLAGLANIPDSLYEAARIDGANRWQLFRHITWPQLAPTTFFVVVMTTIAGVQGGFEQARVMTQGGPAGSTKTLAYYVYERAFEQLDLGYASAIAWVIFIIIFALTLLNWTFGNQETND